MSQSAESIFYEARSMSKAERAGYLKGACGNDLALRSKVEALLAADAEAGSFLKTADQTLDTIDAASSSRESAGQTIGRYKLLEPIGEGGFGSVWAAEQREPVKRRVALKIIKLGMDTKQVIARFEAERQALAMMDHPNIAKVLDAGSTETGRPYFVMELVKGVPILDYCDTEKLDTKSRLDLFTKVCHAIQHAHQKGIIHRDIKPSNVLVTLHDGVAVPKVIDFGIAKATNQELTEKTLFTQHRQMIGTPAYMSPEQAEMSGLDIDTRSDIYSLGVLLYELLTGTTPFENEELMSRGYAEMMRIIREVEPHKPSTRLSTLGEVGTRTAQQRHLADVKKLGLILRGDLDWIVMKCLEKDRTRRYDTANGLAADIVRHLSNEPVTAGPPSAKYKMAKFVKRNRGQVVAGGAIAALLVLGVVGTSYGMVWALNEKGRADTEAASAALAAAAETQARLDAQANEQKAIAEAERAERELARATEIKRLITEMLTSLDPSQAQGADTTLLRGILDDTAERLAAGEITDELVAAELRALLGYVYRQLGLFPQADQHLPVAVETFKRILGEEYQDTLAAMFKLANLRASQGRYDEAESLYRQTLAGQRRVLDEEHPETLDTATNLGGVCWRKGRYSEAESLYGQVLEVQMRVFGREHPGTLKSMFSMATLFWSQGRVAEAEPLFLETLELQKRVLGGSHPQTLKTLNNLASMYSSQGRYSEAEPLLLDTLEVQKRVLGEEHLETLSTYNNLAQTYRLMGRYEDALRFFETNVPIMWRVLGMDSHWTLRAMRGLIETYVELGRPDEATLLIRQLVDRETAAADRPNADADTLNAAAMTLLTIGVEEVRDPARALGYAIRACALEEAAGGEDLWPCLDILAAAQHMTGDSAAAVETQKRVIELAPPGADTSEFERRLVIYEAALAAGGG